MIQCNIISFLSIQHWFLYTFIHFRLQNLSTDQETVENIRKNQHKAYKELNQRIERERQLGILQAKMEAKKLLANKKGEKPVAVIKEETKESAPIFMWPAERKR